VQLRLEEPLPAAAGDRFVIRAGMAGLADGGVTTLGGGRVLSTGQQRLRRARPWIIQGLQARLAALDSPAKWVAVVLAESRQPLSAQALAGQAHLPLDQVQPVLAELAKGGLAVDAGGGKFFHRQASAALAQPILDALEEFHQANPLRAGMEPEQVQTHLQADESLLAAAIEALAAQGEIERHGPLVALAGRKAKLSPREAQLAAQIEEIYKAAGLASPSLAELAGQLGLSSQRAADLVRLLCEQGLLVQLPEEIIMHAGAVEQARRL
jgi:selenocysteine-specific elongation factor